MKKKIQNNETLAPGGGDLKLPFSHHSCLSNFDVRILCCDLRHKDEFFCWRAIPIKVIYMIRHSLLMKPSAVSKLYIASGNLSFLFNTFPRPSILVAFTKSYRVVLLNYLDSNLSTYTFQYFVK